VLLALLSEPAREVIVIALLAAVALDDDREISRRKPNVERG
jgi:hypothetical protein